MTRNERDDLAKLCRQREKLLKADADARAAELMADFQKQLATIHNYNDHVVWTKANAIADAAVAEAQSMVEASLKDLGIPREFAPGLSLAWYGRGENAAKERRAELTRVAASRIEAITKRAKHRIEVTSVDVQTRLLAGSLESEDARRFLESMPMVPTLMPLFTAAEVLDISGVPQLKQVAAGVAEDGGVGEDDGVDE